jgi:U3 small nucleolar RNA-associated protein 14
MRYFLVTYATKASGQIDEVVAVTKQVRQRDLQMCNVIMDYKNKKVEKCVIEGKNVATTWENLDEYYRKLYTNIIERLEKEAVA